MTSSPTREAVEAAATLLEEANGFTLLEKSKGIAGMLRALRARAEAAERERDNWKRRAEDMHRRVTAAEGTAYSRWMRDQRDAARAEAARLREALKPFAARVFNDNGDMTVSNTHLVPTEAFCDAYLALRAALAGEAGCHE